MSNVQTLRYVLLSQQLLVAQERRDLNREDELTERLYDLWVSMSVENRRAAEDRVSRLLLGAPDSRPALPGYVIGGNPTVTIVQLDRMPQELRTELTRNSVSQKHQNSENGVLVKFQGRQGNSFVERLQ